MWKECGAFARLSEFAAAVAEQDDATAQFTHQCKPKSVFMHIRFLAPRPRKPLTSAAALALERCSEPSSLLKQLHSRSSLSAGSDGSHINRAVWKLKHRLKRPPVVFHSSHWPSLRVQGPGSLPCLHPVCHLLFPFDHFSCAESCQMFPSLPQMTVPVINFPGSVPNIDP